MVGIDGFSFLFLIFCVLFFGLLLYNAAYDNLFWMLICVAAIFGITQFGFKYDVLSYAKANIGIIVLSAGVYLLIGIAWAFFKWRKLVIERIAARDASFDRFIDAISSGRLDELKDMAITQNPDWEAMVRQEVLKNPEAALASTNAVNAKLASVFRSRFTVIDKPYIADYKDKFIGWFLFWPFSVIVFFVSDFLKELFEAIYKFFAKKLQSISDNLWNE
jgi:hypothetical protein